MKTKKQIKTSKLKIWALVLTFAAIITISPFVYANILVNKAESYISQLRSFKKTVIYNDHNAELINLSNKLPIVLENTTGDLVQIDLKYVHKMLGIQYPGLLPYSHQLTGRMRPYTTAPVNEFITKDLGWNHDIKSLRLGNYDPSTDEKSKSYRFNTFILSYIGLYEHANYSPTKIDKGFRCSCETLNKLVIKPESIFFYIKKEHEALLSDALLEWRKPYANYMEINYEFESFKMKLIKAREYYKTIAPDFLYWRYKPLLKRIDFQFYSDGERYGD